MWEIRDAGTDATNGVEGQVSPLSWDFQGRLVSVTVKCEGHGVFAFD